MYVCLINLILLVTVISRSFPSLIIFFKFILITGYYYFMYLIFVCFRHLLLFSVFFLFYCYFLFLNKYLNQIWKGKKCHIPSISPYFLQYTRIKVGICLKKQTNQYIYVNDMDNGNENTNVNPITTCQVVRGATFSRSVRGGHRKPTLTSDAFCLSRQFRAQKQPVGKNTRFEWHSENMWGQPPKSRQPPAVCVLWNACAPHEQVSALRLSAWRRRAPAMRTHKAEPNSRKDVHLAPAKMRTATRRCRARVRRFALTVFCVRCVRFAGDIALPLTRSQPAAHGQRTVGSKSKEAAGAVE